MLLLNPQPGNKRLALIAAGLVLGLLGYRVHFCSSVKDLHPSIYRSEGLTPEAEKGAQKLIPIPPEYGIPPKQADVNGQSDACSDTATAEYLRDLRSHVVEHCSSPSGGSISCFHGTINGQDHDQFCVARDVVLNESKRFSLKCDAGLFDEWPRRAASSFDETQRQSGPGAVFDRYFDIGCKPEDLLQSPLQVEELQEEQSNYTILVKREGTGNFWDRLMEIMSMMLSVDTLRMSSDIRLGDSFISVPKDLPRTHVVILDDLAEGPLFDLWSFFAGPAPVRFKDILDDKIRADSLLSVHTAILPLPGSSNPLSQIDQHDVSDCRYSGMVRTFARRVLQTYGVLYPQGGNSISKVVKVTLISGTGARGIRNTDHLLKALHRAFPNVIARAVDLASIPMAEQLKIVQSTEVLVGAHGAGLSHIMFMREGQGAVVEIQPVGLSTTHHQARYRNLAAILGRKYFLTEAEAVPFGQYGGGSVTDTEQNRGGDKSTAVEIELARRATELVISEDVFVAQVGRAIEALVVQGRAYHS